VYLGILSWLLFGVVSAVVAKKKGRSGCAWFALGVVLGPFGLILAFAARPQDGQYDVVAPEPRPLEKCPYCGELIPAEAVRCPLCGKKPSDFRSEPSVSAAEHWTCPRCAAANPNKSSRCANCGYSLEE
jgi:double zinc ribbon protein